ncbi:MAG: hypothetical protein ACJ71W_05960 [Terriglobales bacterium]
MYLVKPTQPTTAMGSLGTNLFTNAWNYYFDSKAFNHDPDNQAPLTQQEKDYIANQAIRATGMDPYTHQPIAPQYASSLPSNQTDRDSLAAKIKTSVIANLNRNYDSSVQDLRDQQLNAQHKGISPIAIALGIAGITLAGVWALK